MSHIIHYCAVCIVLFCSWLPTSLLADDKQITVAVASNFRYALEALLEEHPQEQIWRANDIKIVTGSSGVLYAQIVKGAPFDVFLSADKQRPFLLEQANLTLLRDTYAFGQLVLWRSGQLGLFNKDHQAFSIDTLNNILLGADGKIAIAKPELAPYGAAAIELLQQSAMFEVLESRLVYGTNVTQAFQFVDSGNAKFGILSKSLLVQAGHMLKGDQYKVFQSIPESFHAPIEQQLVVLARAKNRAVALSFANYMLSPSVQAKLQAFGYKPKQDYNNKNKASSFE